MECGFPQPKRQPACLLILPDRQTRRNDQGQPVSPTSSTRPTPASCAGGGEQSGSVAILAQRAAQQRVKSPGERKTIITGIARMSLKRGRQEGRQKGLEQGLARGRQEGRQEGKLLAAREAVRLVLEPRFGRLPAPLLKHLSDLNNLARLKQLLRRAWAATANAIDPTGRAIADFTLAHWTESLAALGRVENPRGGPGSDRGSAAGCEAVAGTIPVGPTSLRGDGHGARPRQCRWRAGPGKGRQGVGSRRGGPCRVGRLITWALVHGLGYEVGPDGSREDDL